MIPPVTIFPELDRLVKVPTEVMLGCAADVTVPAVVAVVADATVPTTLAPGILVSPAPLPWNADAITLPVADTVPVDTTLAPRTLPPAVISPVVLDCHP